ncbi:hypothetical protein IYW40_05785 [Methylocystis sp. H4A]|uniref:hypothetical protein n=1 Tax=Methylocystis sp. H4A TaxID=2785788 RepID=UPI0018C20E34|nr:hypothetical protein [Methylocystis sp. H4A]MBG0800999.1 hypothetical protein [Methylocystis sp. H4A]
MTDICFVIQPFDGGRYDRLFHETYKPAIVAAGYTPYRVDEDPSASIPIERIEQGIRDSSLCFAEITENNPNVWFELGLAIAHEKDVCLVCRQDREKFPFDVQHRLIIRYSSSSPSDFEELAKKITDRLRALARKQEEIATLPRRITTEPTSPELLSDREVACLGVLASNCALEGELLSVYSLRKEMTKAGYTSIATNVAVRSLSRRSLIKHQTSQDGDGDYYDAMSITNNGWEWIERNISNFQLEEEIPF